MKNALIPQDVKGIVMCFRATVFGIIIEFSLGCVFGKEIEVLGGVGWRCVVG